MAKDLYAVLGISRGANADEIKQAYRKMSKEWHPDKHKGDKAAEDKFKEINEAYETLSNPKKKQMYDQFGSTNPGAGGFGGGQGFGGFDFSGGGGGVNFGDIFESFFGGARGGGEPDLSGRNREVQVTIDLTDAVLGKRVDLNLDGEVECDTCKGSGAKPGSDVVRCKTCNGTGQVEKTAQSFFGMIRQAVQCTECQGTGKIPEKPCDDCSGKGSKHGVRTVSVDIPAGIDDGQALRLKGEGEAGMRGGQKGDLFVHVRVKRDPRFQRDGSDIHANVPVHVLDVLLGAEKEVETVHGGVKLSIPAGTQPGQVLRVKGKGMPILNTSRVGDHYVHIDVEIPSKLSKQERKIVEEWKEAKGS